ncbi:Histidyl-tRNA synthetase [Mycena chlorophos]|uniref:histidine--tRNA ligase n=1 Tax=Mycena chlorophos TaxID=658473 RepID=A0A8H6RWH6_MYCCL|nr:Histidyl-tRNA synthetase [Mycena chlorophos]
MLAHRLLFSLGRRRPFSMSSLEELVATQTALFNQLRESKAEASVLDEAKKKLGELKNLWRFQKPRETRRRRTEGRSGSGCCSKRPRAHATLVQLRWLVAKTSSGRSRSASRPLVGVASTHRSLSARTSSPTSMAKTRNSFSTLWIRGGEQLALRYDHTVPLARYLAMAGGTNTQSKIWQVGKVYRRDNPVMSKGRMREFSQADFDISGVWDPMIPDGEIISLVCTVLTKLNVGEFTVKINHRKILDGIFEVCGVPADKIRSISSAVDKLDKLPWSEVKKEMTAEKGLDEEVADKIGEYVKHKGGPALLEQLLADPNLTANASAKQGLDEMGLLFTLLRAYDVVDKLSFDLSLARGLDYYTGIIYEAVVAASAPPALDALTAPKPKSKKPKKDGDEDEEVDDSQVGVGSIAAGGRYDNLVGAFTAAAAAEGKKAPSIPCIGISFGLDRIFALLWPSWVERGGRTKGTIAYVMAAGDGLLEERIKLVRELRDGGIKADFLAKSKPKPKAQFDVIEADEVPFAVIIGADELKRGEVTVKEQTWQIVDGKREKVKNADQGTAISRAKLVEWIKSSAAYQTSL